MNRTNLAVGLRSVGPGEPVTDVSEHVAELKAPIAPSIVSDHLGDDDLVSGEEGVRSQPEARCSGAAFVAENLGVREAAVIVHRRVDVHVAGPIAICSILELGLATQSPTNRHRSGSVPVS